MQVEKRDVFEIEKQIYNTQWLNIRHHWDETIKSIRYLSTLIIFAILPLKFLKVTTDGIISFSLTAETELYLKCFVVVMIAALGILTLLNQFNHFMRSKEARKVVVKIESNWNLYDDQGNFLFQTDASNYQYGNFAGGEKRMSHSQIQFGYIIAITLIGIGFVLFA